LWTLAVLVWLVVSELEMAADVELVDAAPLEVLATLTESEVVGVAEAFELPRVTTLPELVVSPVAMAASPAWPSWDWLPVPGTGVGVGVELAEL